MALIAMIAYRGHDKSHIQSEVSRRFVGATIEPDEEARAEMFSALTHFLTRDFILLLNAENEAIEASQGTIEAIVNASSRFYEGRRSYLSITDFVTDFPDIARSAGFGIALR